MTNIIPRHLLQGLLGSLALASVANAQTPRPLNAPPWWGVNDAVTVSLYWDFSGSSPLVPLQVAVPVWYNPAVTQGTITGNLQVFAQLGGKTDVLGLAPNSQSAQLQIRVDNIPYLNWVKIFNFQFDTFEGAAGSIVESLERDLSQYERSSVTWSTTSPGSGWETVNITAQLWPQPDDEEMSWTFVADTISDIGMDNLFVSSRCVEMDSADEDGKALGEVDQASFPPQGLNLLAATGETCIGVAVTEIPTSNQATYWVSALGTALSPNHRVVQLDLSGQILQSTALPDTVTSAPLGATDLAVEVVPPAPSTPQQQTLVYAVVDRRSATTPTVILRAIDVLTGALVPTADVTIANFPAPAPQVLSLAYNPFGNSGSGTFLITDQSGNAYEVDRQGNIAPPITGLPDRITGSGFDYVHGNYYLWSEQPTTTPQGQLEVNGFELSGYSMQLTGTRFWGSLQVPNPGGPIGGSSAGLHVYRRASGEFRIAGIARSSAGNRLYELEGPFQFGRSVDGVMRMSGLPFEGAAQGLTMTLDGRRPAGDFAALYVGFSNTLSGSPPLPFDLSNFGLAESQVLVSLDMNGSLQSQQTNGQFVYQLPTLPPGFSGTPLFFQWLVFATPPSMSAAGKTLIY